MEKNSNNSFKLGRKRFTQLGLFVFGGAVIGKFIPAFIATRSKSASGQKVKLLTADGKLVEVDKAYLKKGKKVSGKEILAWVKKPGSKG